MRLSKKVLSIVLALFVCFGCLPVISIAAEDGTIPHLTEVPEGYVGVYTKDDLDYVRLNMSGKYILMNDIIFNTEDYQKGGSFYNSGKGWEPIGTYSTKFTGVFDGNGYTIKNLYINNPEQEYIGLFGCSDGATIKNVTVESGNITGVNYTGGIVGSAVISTVERCSYHGSIIGSEKVGGIAGYISGDMTLSFCDTQGECLGTKYVGGIVGYQYSGYSSNEYFNYIKYCNNASSVNGESCIGGIVGYSSSASYEVYYDYRYYDTYGYSYVEYCSNSGIISADDTTAGGIVGYSTCYGYNRDTYGTYYYSSQCINYCYNSGNVKASDNAGGLIGQCYSSSTEVKHSYSVGTVTSTNNFGGCYGTSPKSSVFCYYLDEAVTAPTCAVGIAKSEDQLKKLTAYEQWDFTNTWTMVGREDYPYPELIGVPLVLPEDYIEHEHKYTSKITKEATHTTTGIMTYTCSCGDTYTEIIAKLTAHSYTATVTDPTCTDKGYTTYTCICGHTYVDDYVNAKGHTESDWIIDKSATCTNYGSKHKDCMVCGDTLETKAIPATGHSVVVDSAIPATCLIPGKTSGSHCSACGEIIIVPTIVPATGHTSSDWIINETATCTTDGSKHKECTVCDEVIETVVINANGHTSSDWIIDVEATVIAEGSKHKECTVCGETLETATIPQLKPSTPKVKAVNTIKGMNVTWNAVDGAVKYGLYKRLGTDNTWTFVTTLTGTSYADNDAPLAGKYYVYTVKAYNSAGIGSEYIKANCASVQRVIAPKTGAANVIGGINVSWPKVAGASKYVVLRRIGTESTWKIIGETTGNKLLDANVTEGIYYIYSVRAVNNSGYSEYDINKRITVQRILTPLATATNLVNGVQVKWNAVTSATKYNVYRRTAGSSVWTLLGTTTGTSFTDKNVVNGTYYVYSIRAINGTGYSAFDTTKTDTIQPITAPTAKVVNKSNGVQVSWNSVSGVTKYNVYRRLGGTSNWIYVGTTTSTTLLDKGVVKGRSYAYSIRAINGTGYSAYNSSKCVAIKHI